MTKPSQSGIAIAPILFVVAILAVLASAIAAGSGAFNSSSSTVNDKAMAAAIIEMGQQYKHAVNRILANGYTDTQISFEDPSGIYLKLVNGSQGINVNPNCTEDTCKVFKPAGGAVVPMLIPEAARSDEPHVWSISTYLHPQSFAVYANRSVLNMGSNSDGSDGTDLVMRIGTLKKSVCIKINELLGVENPAGEPPFGGACSNTAYFRGTYEGCAGSIGESAYRGYPVAGKEAFCYSHLSPAHWSFYQVLIAR